MIASIMFWYGTLAIAQLTGLGLACLIHFRPVPASRGAIIVRRGNVLHVEFRRHA